MTTTPLATAPETVQSTGQAGGQASLPPLKTRIDFRASEETVRALLCVQRAMNCDRTAAIEIAVARLAAWLKPDKNHE
jgi:hypothetical protein